MDAGPRPRRGLVGPLRAQVWERGEHHPSRRRRMVGGAETADERTTGARSRNPRVRLPRPESLPTARVFSNTASHRNAPPGSAPPLTATFRSASLLTSST